MKRDRRYCVYKTSVTSMYTGGENDEKRPIYMKKDLLRRLLEMSDIAHTEHVSTVCIKGKRTI